MSNQYLSFDFGTKYIGVAIGQDVTCTARPLMTIKRQGRQIDWPAIRQIIQKWKPKALIVGMPQEMSAKNQWMTVEAQKFVEQLKLETPCVVHIIDECLSTIEAKQALFDQGGSRALVKEAIDAMAAKVILETWLAEKI